MMYDQGKWRGAIILAGQATLPSSVSMADKRKPLKAYKAACKGNHPQSGRWPVNDFVMDCLTSRILMIANAACRADRPNTGMAGLAGVF
jgi:hypothetical protein